MWWKLKIRIRSTFTRDLIRFDPSTQPAPCADFPALFTRSPDISISIHAFDYMGKAAVSGDMQKAKNAF